MVSVQMMPDFLLGYLYLWKVNAAVIQSPLLSMLKAGTQLYVHTYVAEVLQCFY